MKARRAVDLCDQAKVLENLVAATSITIDQALEPTRRGGVVNASAVEAARAVLGAAKYEAETLAQDLSDKAVEERGASTIPVEANS